MFLLMGFLLLSIIIIIHELGHFTAAKIFKIGIVEYAIGMGPVVYTNRKKDTVFSLRLFPIGGYCALYGENAIETRDKGSEPKKPKKYKFEKEPNYKKDWKDDQSYMSKPKWQQLIVAFAGPLANILTGIIASFIFVIFLGAMKTPTIMRFSEDNHAAVESGIKINDEIIAINDRKVLTYADYSEYTATHINLRDKGWNITVKRMKDGEEKIHTINVHPDPTTNKIGVFIDSAYEKKQTFGEVIKYTTHQSIYWVRVTFDSIYMLTHKTTTLSNMTGIVGTTATIGSALNEANSYGNDALWRTILIFIIFISINLGIMNLLPIPVLDGGRMLIIMIEWIINRKMPQNIEYAFNVVGFGFVMIIMIYTLINDIIRIFTQQL